MENDQLNSPESSHKGQSEDTIFNSLNPVFDLDKYGIGKDEIINETEKLIKQGNEARDKKTNRFPVEVFPLPVQQIITATNENLNFPVDFIGASLLYAVSVAVGNTHRVEVKKGWLESSVLYLAIVARAGTNKSHPLSFALQPIVDRIKKLTDNTNSKGRNMKRR